MSVLAALVWTWRSRGGPAAAWLAVFLALVGAMPKGAGAEPAGPADLAMAPDAASRCMALVAYAEAAGEGSAGLAAVIRVIRNRVADPRFPDDACTVVRSPGEFQPVGDSPRLRLALNAPHAQPMAKALADFAPVNDAILAEAARLARAEIADDPTAGALYFVNPRFMEPAKCPWFADLKRTRVIGAHVFMTHYGTGEAAAGPALDCAQVRRDWAEYVKTAAARGKRTGKSRVNPAWLVAVEQSGRAAGKSCGAPVYDPVTRTLQGSGAC